jgi:ABC-type multidrug transport system fused ATPase/permease subunit
MSEAKQNYQNALIILGQKFRRILFLTAAIQFFLSGLDVLLLALISPFISSISSAEFASKKFKILHVWDLSPIQIFYLMLACVLAKNLTGSMLQFWVLRRFSLREAEVLTAIVQSAVFEKKELGRKLNSSELLQLSTTTVNQIFGGIFRPLVSFMADSMTLIAIFVGLFLFIPFITFLILIYFSFFGIIIGILYGRKQRTIGKSVLANGGYFLEAYTEITRMNTEIWLAHIEDLFLADLYAKKLKYSKSLAISTWLQNLPRYFLELVLFFGLGILVVFLTKVHASENVLPTVGLVIGAGYRILPSLNMIFVSTGNFRNSIPAMSKLLEIGKLLESWDQEICFNIPTRNGGKNRFQGDLFFQNISFGFPDSNEMIFEQFNYSFMQNETTLLRGKNGSGKSTLLSLAIGLISPQRGKIYFSKENSMHPMNDLVTHISLVSQALPLFNNSYGYNIAMREINNSDLPALDKAAREAGILDRVLSNKNGFHASIGENGNLLSAGERQKLGIARSIFSSPQLLVLDEPTANLDLEAEAEIWTLLKRMKGSRTIVIISHRPVPQDVYDQMIELKK